MYIMNFWHIITKLFCVFVANLPTNTKYCDVIYRNQAVETITHEADRSTVDCHC